MSDSAQQQSGQFLSKMGWRVLGGAAAMTALVALQGEFKISGQQTAGRVTPDAVSVQKDITAKCQAQQEVPLSPGFQRFCDGATASAPKP